MIYLFYAQSGTGKSMSITAMMEQFLRNEVRVKKDKKGLFKFLDIPPRERLKLCHSRIDYLNEVEDLKLEKPIHTVQSNLTMWTNKFGKYIQNYDLPGDKIGLYDEFYETYCPAPCSIIVWDETQKEASGRESATMAERVSTLLQLHRKWGLDIICITQRSKILDLNIRDNCVIVEVADVIHKYTKYGFIKGSKIYFNVYMRLADLERNLSTGKKTYTKTSFEYKGNAFDHFDSNEGEEHFIYLAKKQGINLRIRDRNLSTDEYVKNNPYISTVGYKKMTQAQRRKLEKEKQEEQETV